MNNNLNYDINEIDDSLFILSKRTNKENEELQGSSLSFWKDAGIRFKKNKAAVISVYVLVFIIGIAFCSSLLGGYDNNVLGDYVVIDNSYLPPKIPIIEKFGILDGFEDGKDLYAEAGVEEGTYFLFGTDKQGRDLFVRTMVGALVSISFGLVAALIDILIGVSLGGISGYYGGKIDLFLQRVVEVLGSVPRLIWVILIIVYIGTGLFSLVLAIIISGWIPMYRIVRSQVMKIKNQEYVLSALTLGQSNLGIIFKHILPNTLGIIIIWLMFTIPSAIFFEAFLSFLGLGISGDKNTIPTLGSLANSGKDELKSNPYILFLPTLVLSTIMLAFNLVADGLRDAFDPKMKGGK